MIEREIMVQGIHHFAIIVSSELSVDFYKQLGFKETFRKERDYDTVVLMEGYGVGLELFIDPSHPRREAPEPLGLRCISLSVGNIEKAAKEWGIDPGQISADWFGEKYLNITDPDGNTVQLHAD